MNGSPPEPAQRRGSPPARDETSARRWAITAAALAAAAALALLRGPLSAWLLGPGSPASQRPLAPGTGAGISRGFAGIRVVILDGLARADSGRILSLVALCAGGNDLIVDVGFPTKSLIVQEVLWTGLTQGQLGSPYHNGPRSPRPDALPARIAGSIGVVESHRTIAASVGFARVLPGAGADEDEPGHDPAAAEAWQRSGFVEAAAGAVASTARLVLVHVLAIDTFAHRQGRRGAAYQAALLSADRTLAAVRAAMPADTLLVVLADHGHLRRGGHGDAEDEVRRVRACTYPALATAAPGAEIHLIDLARTIADQLGLPLAAGARGRPVAIAVRQPDAGATLREPAPRQWLAALVLLGAGTAIAVHLGGVLSLWPVLALIAWWMVRGAPSLSNPPALDLAIALAMIPGVAAAATAVTPGRLLARCASPCVPALTTSVLSGVVTAMLGGAPARMPWWTGQLVFWSWLTAIAFAVGAVTASARALSVRRTYIVRHTGQR